MVRRMLLTRPINFSHKYCRWCAWCGLPFSVCSFLMCKRFRLLLKCFWAHIHIVSVLFSVYLYTMYSSAPHYICVLCELFTNVTSCLTICNKAFNAFLSPHPLWSFLLFNSISLASFFGHRCFRMQRCILISMKGAHLIHCSNSNSIIHSLSHANVT